ncbi:hypothetical protein HDU87_002192 [Geranomyces variabilis]|uniref:Serine aminopeptidase S33 domain-containing protein n=1 Tax=Geranomyces variabilis TaxID=109894 RepID=A0AAD5TLQ6_9FUNG|nr:hypothetical protein HDU87_002192 [Geranomyces variabilis]
MTESDETTTSFCNTPDGAKLAYCILGAEQNGVPLIMLTGIASVKEDWDDLATALALHRPVCIYDHRGIGASTLAPPLPPFKTTSSLTVTQLATDTFTLVSHLQWRKFHLLGMSMGGMVAQQLVLLLRGRDDYCVQSMTALATSARPRGGRHMAEYYGLLCDELESRKGGGKGKGKNEVEKVVRRFLEGNLTSRWCRENSEKVDEMMRSNATARKPARVIVQQIEALSTGFDLTPQLALINTPTLVIHGTHDEIIPLEHGHAIASGIRGARFLPLRDVGHITYRMDDGQTLRGVDEFMQEIDAKSAVASLTVKL